MFIKYIHSPSQNFIFGSWEGQPSYLLHGHFARASSGLHKRRKHGDWCSTCAHSIECPRTCGFAASLRHRGAGVGCHARLRPIYLSPIGRCGTHCAMPPTARAPGRRKPLPGVKVRPQPPKGKTDHWKKELVTI